MLFVAPLSGPRYIENGRHHDILHRQNVNECFIVDLQSIPTHFLFFIKHFITLHNRSKVFSFNRNIFFLYCFLCRVENLYYLCTKL